MVKWILLLFFVSLASADMMIYNGNNTSETQIGVMKADGIYNTYSFKGSLTEGQPISYNGSTAYYSGQIGYLTLPDATPPTMTLTAIIDIVDDFLFWGLFFLAMFILIFQANLFK